MAKIVEDAKARKRMYALMIALGIVADALWIGALIYGVTSGVWLNLQKLFSQAFLSM